MSANVEEGVGICRRGAQSRFHLMDEESHESLRPRAAGVVLSQSPH